ncbi:hypothetical protein Leryth_000893 [Lithospermum erythrorhizon]|nr:hypothetical protein Leryth_000893 [Lithospermum erythrorhizon]
MRNRRSVDLIMYASRQTKNDEMNKKTSLLYHVFRLQMSKHGRKLVYRVLTTPLIVQTGYNNQQSDGELIASQLVVELRDEC